MFNFFFFFLIGIMEIYIEFFKGYLSENMMNKNKIILIIKNL